MTTTDLTHLEALDAAATPGPWSCTDAGAIVAPLTGTLVADVWEPTAATRNGEFIETARTAMPRLVAELRQAHARIAELEAGIRRRDTEREHWTGVHNLVQRAISKRYPTVDTRHLEDALGPESTP